MNDWLSHASHCTVVIHDLTMLFFMSWYLSIQFGIFLMYCVLLPWPSFSLMMLTCLVIYEAKKASLSIRTRRNLKDHFIPSTTRLQTPFFYYFGIFPRTLLMCCVFSCSVVSNSLQPCGLWPTRLLCPWGFSRQEYWSELPCPSSGDLPNPGIKPRSPTLQVDYLSSEPPGKPKNTEAGSLSFLQGNFPTQESNRGLLPCRWILYQLS